MVLETLALMTGLGAMQVWWMKREAKRLGIPWDKFMKMSAEEKRQAGARI